MATTEKLENALRKLIDVIEEAASAGRSARSTSDLEQVFDALGRGARVAKEELK